LRVTSWPPSVLVEETSSIAAAWLVESSGRIVRSWVRLLADPPTESVVEWHDFQDGLVRVEDVWVVVV
jgi:hypothetical protein